MNANEYATKDFYLGACLLASRIPLIRLDRLNERSFNFVFEISTSNAEKIITDHWNRKLLIPSRDLAEAINELKTRIYERK